MKELCLFLLFARASVAAPIGVIITGNFGPGSAGASILDNQSYSILYTVPDPHSPSNSYGDANTANATYLIPVQLNIPGLNFSVTNMVGADYRNQQPLGLWLNLMTFTGLPVGDFMVMTPLQTTDGAPLWNGLAGGTGTPELLPLNNDPASTRFFLEQVTGQGPIPIAVYENGTASISQTGIPEPAPMVLVGVALSLLLRRSVHKPIAVTGRRC